MYLERKEDMGPDSLSLSMVESEEVCLGASTDADAYQGQ